MAVWRGSVWYIWASATSTTRAVEWGSQGAPYHDQAAPGDYDGDGQADVAVWCGPEQTWYVRTFNEQRLPIRVQGQVTDMPVSANSR